MGFPTLGTEAKRVIRKNESYLLTESYVAKAALAKGAIVKIDPVTNEVEAVSAAADVPLGMVVKGCNDAGEKVTITTEYVAMVKGIADNAIAIGDEVAATAYDSVQELAQYDVAVSTNYVVGVAMTAAATTEEVWVGILRSFRVKP